MNVLFTALLSEGSIIDLDNTLFIQLGVFAVAFLILRPLVFRPMIALFEARDSAIHGAKLEAQRLQDQAEAGTAEFDEEMRKLRLQAGEARDRLRDEGKELERAVLDKVREETARKMADADAELKSESDKLRTEVQANIPALARDIASKMLSREVR